MTLKDLLNFCDFEAIAPHIREIDPKQGEMLAFYKEAYDQLLHMTSEPADNDIEVSAVRDDESGGAPHIHARNCEGDFWSRCLSKKIIIEEGVSVSDEFLAATILWHLTFWGFNQEEINGAFEETHRKLTRKEKINRLISRILASGTDLTEDDLKYLFKTKTIWEFEYHTRAYNSEKRIDYLQEEILKYGQKELYGGKRYLLIISASPEKPLLMGELLGISRIIERLQKYGPATFGYGTREDLGEELHALIVKSE